MRRRLIAPLGLLVLLLTAQAVYAADLADAQAAKANCKQYKDGAEQWRGLYEQHRYDAVMKFEEANALYWYMVDEWVIAPETPEDATFWHLMSLGGDPYDAENSYLEGSECQAMMVREVTAAVHLAGAAGDYNLGNNALIQTKYDEAVGHYNTAAAPPPATKFQSAADNYAHGIDEADQAKAKWQDAIDYLWGLVPPQ